MTERSYRSIGEVVALLEPEFPDVTISKVRFLERRGVLDPARAPSGYRRYSDTDLAQLRWVLTLQRDQFLPLRVIAERLAAGEFSSGPDPAKARPARRAPVDPVRPSRPGAGVPASELRARTGLSAEQLASLEQLGLIVALAKDGRRVYCDDALRTAEVAAGLFTAGLEPRHLRSYKLAADREAALIEQRTAGLDGAEGARVAADLVHLGAELRALLLRGALRQPTEKGSVRR